MCEKQLACKAPGALLARAGVCRGVVVWDRASERPSVRAAPLPVYCVLVLAGSELRRVSSSSAAAPGSSSRDVNTTGTMLLWKVIIHRS